ncbi:hypothetical protein HN018_20210 [Lichenicola cladoniae]|uniref:NHL repeat-containing protein n=1 Tax=Lichenicola cladoniae TaxID=1484109 RepID=A0A6M8HU40_9PROT|nr:hypothetical protein [Lichenicola cladoniae]NPD66186.1 hypothetical protein [Acetobacteraceae bacterium]QKE92049.1 hypothetical protein HN018_20210 [Lichenicola cladoniae]
MTYSRRLVPARLPASLRTGRFPAAFCVIGMAVLASTTPGMAAEAPSFLSRFKHHTTVASTVPANGDQNPYAVFVSPVSKGRLVKDQVLVGNFNNAGNLQGLGTTIVQVDPATQAISLFASVPQKLDKCPGGVGLTTALAVLKSGWVIIGSLPSTDGTTATKGDGCLLLFDADGKLADVWTSPKINGPWGNMAVIDKGTSATLFVSNAGFGVGAPPAGAAPIVSKATVVRVELQIPDGGKPHVTAMTVVADGFGEAADKSVFIIGPTGIALGAKGSIYVSDAIGNRIVSIPDALTRTDSAGTGTEITRDGLLKRPLALVNVPNGNLLVANGLNGQVVEIDPVGRRQVGAQWVDVDKAQQPPGSGDLFGLAVTPKGDGFYYVEDDMNTLVLAH